MVQRIVAAGAVTIGKTNIPEYAAGGHTFNEVFGTTRNPYDLRVTAGGSSGGAAAALAAGLHPLADGNDMGGSLRLPAGYCNVVGLRPSAGRVPAYPATDGYAGLSVPGPMARTVADVLARRLRALFLNAKASTEMAPRVADLMMRELGTNEQWAADQVRDFHELAKGYIL